MKFKRQAIFEQGVWKIPLTRGEYAIVDECDVEFLQQWNWYVWESPEGMKYAKRNIRYSPFVRTHDIKMHRVVAERWGILTTTKLIVDHKNLNGLDNRTGNLRIATFSQNMANKRVRKDSRSGVRGVNFHKKTGKWQSSLMVNGVRHYLGLRDTPEEAAELYAEASAKLHKEFGRTE